MPSFNLRLRKRVTDCWRLVVDEARCTYSTGDDRVLQVEHELVEYV